MTHKICQSWCAVPYIYRSLYKRSHGCFNTYPGTSFSSYVIDSCWSECQIARPQSCGLQQMYFSNDTNPQALIQGNTGEQPHLLCIPAETRDWLVRDLLWAQESYLPCHAHRLRWLSISFSPTRSRNGHWPLMRHLRKIFSFSQESFNPKSKYIGIIGLQTCGLLMFVRGLTDVSGLYR